MRTRSLLLAAAVLLAACGEQRPLPSRAAVGEPAPAYRAVTLAGDSAGLESLRGDVVLLNVWATWCHPCREEIPALQKLHEEYAGRGLQVVGVSVDAEGDTAEIRDFTREFGMTYPVWLDPDERVSSTFRLVGVPSTFLIDREGTIVWKHLGPVVPGDPQLTEVLEEALGVRG